MEPLWNADVGPWSNPAYWFGSDSSRVPSGFSSASMECFPSVLESNDWWSETGHVQGELPWTKLFDLSSDVETR